MDEIKQETLAPVKVGAYVEVTPRNNRVEKFIAEVKAITKDGRYILWYGQYSIWDRNELAVIEIA